MCLLVKQSASTSFTDDFLIDVFSKNSDGLGVMYADEGKMHIFKCLPTTAQDFIDFYRAHIDNRDCVWHARMQTHGDIDMENCHPYRVTDDVWMAHNGILATGNNNDKTRSDTWHFIKNVLRPALESNPDLLLDADYQNFLASMIGGSNKFGFVRSDGQIVVINEQAGVEFCNSWLSNTYAWSPAKFGFRSSYQGTAGYTDMYSGYGRSSSSSWYSRGFSNMQPYYEDEDTEDLNQVKEVKGSYVGNVQASQLSSSQIRPMVKAAFNSWSRRGIRGIEQWVVDAPHKAAAILGYWYDDITGVEELVADDPITAAEWIEDLFTTDSITPSLYE